MVDWSYRIEEIDIGTGPYKVIAMNDKDASCILDWFFDVVVRLGLLEKERCPIIL